MKRIKTTPRAKWQDRVEKVGLTFHSIGGKPYWDETAYYQFTRREIDGLEAATNELQRLCLEAGQHIIDKNRFSELAIPETAVPLIKRMWDEEPPALYGRFDLAYDGENPPKMLEYNADTPTSLLEAAVVQWFWLQDVDILADQFNSIHDRLIAKWKELRDYIKGGTLYFGYYETEEDAMTVAYLQETATQAGFKTQSIKMSEVGWDGSLFVDLTGHPIRSIFKLYPWEWLMNETFAAHLVATADKVQWMEPAWKMLWSNKGILPILWELFPDHPNLLESHFQKPRSLASYVRKPMLSREGGNVTIVKDRKRIKRQGGAYGEGKFVYQKLAPIPNMDGNYPVIGSWVIDGEAAGMGIRESTDLITGNFARFVPHLFR